MDFIQHTIAWCKGEIFEAKLIVLFSIIVVVSGILFHRIGNTPSTKAMLFPLLIVGLIFLVTGAGMLYSNPRRIREYTLAYEKVPKALIISEKERTELFIKWYPITRYVAAGVGLLGILMFLFWEVPIGKAISISLLLLCLATFVIDHFSEERALIYYRQIDKALK